MQYKSITVKGKRFHQYDNFNTSDVYYVLINYEGDDKYKNIIKHTQSFKCNYIGGWNNGEHLYFRSIEEGLYITLHLDEDATRNSARIFKFPLVAEGIELDYLYECLWCQPYDSAFDDTFFVVSDPYKIRFLGDKEYTNCVLTKKNVDALYFRCFEPTITNANESRNYERMMSESEYKKILDRFGKDSFISLTGNEWSDDKEEL